MITLCSPDADESEKEDLPRFTFYDRHDRARRGVLLSLSLDADLEVDGCGEDEDYILTTVPLNYLEMADVIHIADWLENAEEQAADS